MCGNAFGLFDSDGMFVGLGGGGFAVCACDGLLDGFADGIYDGFLEGIAEGTCDEYLVGFPVGIAEGNCDGCNEASVRSTVSALCVASESRYPSSCS